MFPTRFRFSLKSLAIIIAVVGIALWAVPAAMEWYYWHEVRATVVDTMEDLATRHEEPSVFLGVVKNNEYYLANHEIKWDPSQNAMVDLTDARRSDAIFVTWPRKTGQWVNSSDEVVQLLRQHD
jgi:hypothetical protein